MKKLISAFSLLAMISVATPVFADTTSTVSQIQALLSQLQSLQAQMQALKTQQQQITANLVSTLKQGSSGDQVKILQAILAADPSIYPEGLITGTFGKLTAKAVKKFQEKNGLEQVGNVGPMTLKMLNKLLGDNPIALESTNSSTSTNYFGGGKGGRNGEGEGDHRPCAIVPPGHLIAPGWLKKHNENDQNTIVPPCQTLPPGIWNKLNDNENDHHSTSTTPTSTLDTTAPVISNIGASAATSTATVLWTTNEGATSQVSYGTSTALGLNTTLDTGLVTTHSQALTGLTPGTTYYYMVRSSDTYGNTATSSQGSFITSVVDTTPPVISSTTITTTTSTATIGWITNENATSQVFYGTSTAMGLNTTLDTGLVTTHSQVLTGLTATTTYYYQIQSKDASGNIGNSSQGSFVTPQS